MRSMTTTLLLAPVLLATTMLLPSASAFVPTQQQKAVHQRMHQHTQRPFADGIAATVRSTTTSSSSSLSERKWNFNEGSSPWGLKKNAETWNGRVAQMAFVWIFLQELVTGKGVFKGIDESDPFFIANAVIFGLSVVALTAWLAIQGDDDYTKDVM